MMGNFRSRQQPRQQTGKSSKGGGSAPSMGSFGSWGGAPQSTGSYGNWKAVKPTMDKPQAPPSSPPMGAQTPQPRRYAGGNLTWAGQEGRGMPFQQVNDMARSHALARMLRGY